jgi:hypothetical protein
MSPSHKGQAWYVLSGYRYQLLQSLDAWIGLRPGEVLWLETEEDFSVASTAGAVDTQVKSSAAAAGPRPHSLRSEGVRAALSRYWVRSDQGRDPPPQLAFIAKGRAARERGLTFPNDMAGIDYWAAAVLGADTSPMRTALAAIFEDEPLGEWIESNPSDEELRARLLGRVRWMLQALDEGPLTELIRDKIAELYLIKGLLVTLADEALRSLLDRVFETACEPDQNNRHLRAIDLHRSLELAAGPSVALQSAARTLSGASTGAADDGLFVVRIGPLSGNICDRSSTVEDIFGRVRGEPLIWLHGAHGVGKSTLARLIAAKIGGSWLGLDLRAVQDEPKAALSAWRELGRAVLRDPQISGIVIDDFAGPAMEALRSRLAAFVSSVAPRGTRMIVTSAYEPPAGRLPELGASLNAAIQAPYFTEAEVRALVTNQNGPADDMVEGWTRLIHLTTNGGHPLLVSAKVASLKARSWPESALLEDFGATVSDAVRATRDEARRRLIDEIPSVEARQLLRRIGCIFDRADDGLVLALARDDPSIANVGDALVTLRGSWIEVMPGGDLRLSPLIADIASDIPEEGKLQYRQTAAEYWLSTRVLDQRTLPLCFWNAFWGKHSWVLARLVQVIETLPFEQLRGAAAMLSPMTMFRTDQTIYPEAPPLGAMLRLLQFEVANAVEEKEIAGRVALRLMTEINEIDVPELRLLQNSVAVPKILLAEHANLEPAKELELALHVRAVMQEIATANYPELSGATAGIGTIFEPGVDMAGFLFAAIVLRIRRSDRMLQMIEALDNLNEGDRNGFIDAAAISLHLSPGSFVHNGWAQEQSDELDLKPALERFVRMSEIAKRWHRADIIIELACARSVILDEGLNDKMAAIAVVDEAIEEMGSAPALVRQKAKVLGHSGDDGAAAKLLISVEDSVGSDNPFDRALALRDGGVSAARAKLFSDAIRLFSKAHDSLRSEDQHPALAVGIKVELALVRWESEDRSGALTELADALDAVEPLDPAGSRQNERAHQYARATIGLFWKKLDPYPSDTSLKIAFGQPSALAGDEPLLSVDLKPLAYNWRILALCEIEIGADLGIERRSAAKQIRGGLPAVELFIAMSRYARAVANEDIVAAFRLGALAVSAQRVVAELRAADGALEPLEIGQLESKSLEMLLAEAGSTEILRNIPLDLLVWHRFHGGWAADLASRIGVACATAWGDSAAISDILQAASGGTAEHNPSTAIALAVRLASASDLVGNPRVRFERDLILIFHTANSFARRVLEPLVVPHIVEGWTTVVNDEGFALRAPLQHTPAIRAAIAETETTGLRGAAKIILAAAPAVRVSLTEAWIKPLRLISGAASSTSEPRADQ